SAILNDDPPALARVDGPVPDALARIVSRCLEKQPSARFQTAEDLAFALETLPTSSSSAESIAQSPVPPTGRGPERAAWIALALALLALAGWTYSRLGGARAPAASPIRFQIPPMVELSTPSNFAVSPDGRQLAFYGLGPDRVPRLYLRSMDTLGVR